MSFSYLHSKTKKTIKIIFDLVKFSADYIHMFYAEIELISPNSHFNSPLLRFFLLNPEGL